MPAGQEYSGRYPGIDDIHAEVPAIPAYRPESSGPLSLSTVYGDRARQVRALASVAARRRQHER